MKLWKQTFLRIVKSFLTNNGFISNNFIRIENDNNRICNEQELVELFNEHYINKVETSSGEKPFSLGNSSDASQDEMTDKEISFIYSDHPSI